MHRLLRYTLLLLKVRTILHYNIFTRLRMSIRRRSSETRRLRDSARLDRSPQSLSLPGARHDTLKHSHNLNETEIKVKRSNKSSGRHAYDN